MRKNMNLQTWAEWVGEIDSITGGGIVELFADKTGKGMVIAVKWSQNGKPMEYGYAISMLEMKSMYLVVQPCVLDRITHEVRKMMEIGKEATTGLALADKQIHPGVTRQDVCIWTQDSDGTWNTSCSKTWEFIEGGPTDNEMHFCHHCGGELISEPFSEDLEPD